MLDELQAEINNHPDLVTASPRIVMGRLNEPGSALEEAWVINPDPVMLTINDVYTGYISNESLDRLIDFLADPGNKAMALRFEKATHFNLSSPIVRGLLAGLYAAEVVTEAENAALERAGEVLKSRAEELFDRKITLEDF